MIIDYSQNNLLKRIPFKPLFHVLEHDKTWEMIGTPLAAIPERSLIARTQTIFTTCNDRLTGITVSVFLLLTIKISVYTL